MIPRSIYLINCAYSGFQDVTGIFRKFELQKITSHVRGDLGTSDRLTVYGHKAYGLSKETWTKQGENANCTHKAVAHFTPYTPEVWGFITEVAYYIHKCIMWPEGKHFKENDSLRHKYYDNLINCNI